MHGCRDDLFVALSAYPEKTEVKGQEEKFGHPVDAAWFVFHFQKYGGFAAYHQLPAQHFFSSNWASEVFPLLKVWAFYISFPVSLDTNLYEGTDNTVKNGREK